MTATRPITNERAAGLLDTAWTLDLAHTHVEFAARHLMITTVRGRFGNIAGYLRLRTDHPFAPEVEITIDAASLDTREERRDTHLRSADFLDVVKHPTITFSGRSVDGDILHEFRLTGDLTIRGVTKQITLHARNEGRTKDPWGNEKMGIVAMGRLDRQDFGLKWNMALETGGMLVSDEVTISVEAQFTREVPAER